MKSPQTETPVETLEQIAKEIAMLSRCGPITADGVAAFVVEILERRILQGLRNEREACAKVADRFATEAKKDAAQAALRKQYEVHEDAVSRERQAEGIARAIREGR